MLKFNTVKMTDEKMDLWVSLGVNVLLIGEKGVGKTQRILEAFNRNNIKFSYFSGATLDPWIHLIGIPKVKKDANDKDVMDFILPSNLDDDIEAVYVDEFNRCPKLVKNALLELQQFKTINGRKFPNLKMVWAAINPSKDENDVDSVAYDVEELDPAQMDRFHVIVELPNKPDIAYFKGKYGEYKAKCLVEWWHAQTNESKKILSPRRLEYIGELFEKGIDIHDLLPVSANATDLIKKLSIDENQLLLNELLANPTESKIKAFLKNKKNWLKYKTDLSNNKYWFGLKHLDAEYLCDEIKTGTEDFKNYAILQALKGEPKYEEALKNIQDANPDILHYRVFKLLKSENLNLEKYEQASGNVNKMQISGVVFLDTVNGSEDEVVNFIGEKCNATFALSNRYPEESFTEILRARGVNSTFTFKSLITHAEKCWNNIQSNRLLVIKLLISALASFQSATINQLPTLLPLLASMLNEAANWGHINDVDERLIIRDLKNLKNNKISNLFVDSMVQLVSGNTSTATVLIDEFGKKVKETEDTINLIKNHYKKYL